MEQKVTISMYKFFENPTSIILSEFHADERQSRLLNKVAIVLRALSLFGVILLTSACATLDFDQPREPSYALADTSDTPLAEKILPDAAAYPGKSGFALLNDGIEALAARVLLMREATRSIDAQYYFILNDTTGNLFVRELLAAADRGVRVRLLLDDIATQGYDLGMAALDAHPNFEIRIFNPFTRRTGRYLNVRDFARVNRRMHNKSFIVDNQVIIVGGRNIGNEYFVAQQDMNFADMDVFGVGPVARQGSAVFDEFWNDRHSLPVSALVAPLEDPDAGMLALREHIEEKLLELKSTPYANAFVDTGLDLISPGSKTLSWVPYKLVSDPPSKAWDDKDSDKKLISPISAVIKEAENEFILISPYFVPRNAGIAEFQKLRDRGVEVRVLTNSLAATDVSAVHGGYAPARKPLLRMGVKLYEVRADADIKGIKRSGIKGSRSSLHTKGFIVDRRTVFFGSFNFDPRSAHINTEMGIFMDAPEMAEELAESLNSALERGHKTYEVVLSDGQQLRWLDKHDGTVDRLRNEPQTSFWNRFVAGFFRILPIRGQL
jgi:putative cardiolipin synthase